jgi:nitrate/TMAO reductase-like tetraheme cytochrome c subunit
MTRKTVLRKTLPWTLGLIGILFVVALPVGGFAFAATQESHDAFCGSCHTEPESTYLERSTAAQPVDLASYHTTQTTRCIDCHSGKGIGGRMGAELMGAGNAVKWYSGTAVQPAPLTRPIGDGNCLKCHEQVTDRGYVPKNNTLRSQGEGDEAPNGHWHVFLPRWQSRDTHAATCVSCHTGHATDGNVQILYLNEQHTEAVCDSCHQVLGEE